MKTNEFEKRARYQGGYDRVFDDWKIIDIHEVPSPVREQEVDFYCCNSKKVYLLRVCNKAIEKYEMVYSDKDKKMGYPPYLIAELPVQEIDNELLKHILRKFEL